MRIYKHWTFSDTEGNQKLQDYYIYTQEDDKKPNGSFDRKGLDEADENLNKQAKKRKKKPKQSQKGSVAHNKTDSN